MLEQMADQTRLDHDLPGMWEAALERNCTSPDWPARRAPTGCALDEQAYTALLRDRTPDCPAERIPAPCLGDRPRRIGDHLERAELAHHTSAAHFC